jgi:hypothetical protein
MRAAPDEAMETRAHTPTRRPRRVLAGLALLLALLGCAVLSAAAFARTAHSAHRSGCATRHRARHGAVRHCSRRRRRKVHGTHKQQSMAKAPAPAPKPAVARCEDGNLPARSASGEYDCEDGSEPACEGGSEPLRPSAGSGPVCPTVHEVPDPVCGTGGECEEFACEDPSEAVAPSKGCEYGSAFEEEAEPAF